IQAVRDASLLEVGKVLRYAIEHRDQLDDIAARQAAGEEITVDADFISAARAAMAAGEDPAALLPNTETTDVVAEAEEVVAEYEAAPEVAETDAD
ncbi:hypothetical protein ACFWWS_37860, partial [Streptomyces sp. NPDC059083]|uniref:hypothetical protein n=1 Tax=Streptomyces sp. NPDC059083 TaxID=3346721 RepID=UPI00367BFEB9